MISIYKIYKRDDKTVFWIFCQTNPTAMRCEYPNIEIFTTCLIYILSYNISTLTYSFLPKHTICFTVRIIYIYLLVLVPAYKYNKVMRSVSFPEFPVIHPSLNSIMYHAKSVQTSGRQVSNFAAQNNNKKIITIRPTHTETV